MKKILFAMALVLASVTLAFAADTTQTIQSQAWDELYKALAAAALAALGAIGTALTGAVATLGYKVWEAIKKWLAGTRQGQLMGILTTALEIAVAKKARELKKHYWQLLVEFVTIFKDGKVSPEERARLLSIRQEVLNDAALIAGDMIAECRGLAADEGAKYLRERLDALLGELEYRLTGSPAALIPSSVGDSPAAES